MGSFHAGVPEWLITWITQETTIRRSVETGTFYGDSAQLLANSVGACTSIEIDPEYARRARARFANRSDISIVEGDSSAVLASLCDADDTPAFYWLDGHWSGGDTGGAENPCPVLAEIDAICHRQGIAGNVLAIDDARLFGMPHALDPTMQHFPRTNTVLSRLDHHGAQTFLVDDVIVAVPAQLATSFMALHSQLDIRQNTNFAAAWPSLQRAQRNNRARMRARALTRRLLRPLRRAHR